MNETTHPYEQIESGDTYYEVYRYDKITERFAYIFTRKELDEVDEILLSGAFGSDRRLFRIVEYEAVPLDRDNDHEQVNFGDVLEEAQ